MKKIKNYFFKKLELSKMEFMILIVIIVLSIVLRFINFDNRWGLAYDQARDLLVANYALNTFQIPLIGPFTSAGAFVYGPQWYWILMLFSVLSFGTVVGPWVILSVLYVFAVFIVFLTGKEIAGNKLGLIAASLVAVSTLQINQSTNLTSPSMVGFLAIITCFYFIRYVKYSKSVDAFLLGFLISTTINVHFQALGLLSLALVGFLFSKKSIKKTFLLITGLLIPFIPLLIFDLKTNFYESRNILDYYLYGQYKIYVPNRWLTYAGTYWPEMWGRIIGGFSYAGYVGIVGVGVATLYLLIRHKITKVIISLLLSFSIMVLMLRYYRGERFESYLAFTHGFVILLTALFLHNVFRINKIAGLLLIGVFMAGSIWVTIPDIKNASNNTAFLVEGWKNDLYKQYPGQKFEVYDYKFRHANLSYPLSLYLLKDNRISDGGHKVGIIVADSDIFEPHFTSIIGNKGSYRFFDLNSSSSAQLADTEWALANPKEVYRTIQLWYVK